MSATYQITSAQITDFIAFVLSNLEDNLAFDLERLHKKSAPGYFDYDLCRSNLRESLSRADNQLQGVSLLFSSYPEIREEITVAMKTAVQLYDTRFEEVQALAHPEKQSSADQSSLSSLELPVETPENSAVEIVHFALPNICCEAPDPSCECLNCMPRDFLFFDDVPVLIQGGNQ